MFAGKAQSPIGGAIDDLKFVGRAVGAAAGAEENHRLSLDVGRKAHHGQDVADHHHRAFDNDRRQRITDRRGAQFEIATPLVVAVGVGAQRIARQRYHADAIAIGARSVEAHERQTVRVEHITGSRAPVVNNLLALQPLADQAVVDQSTGELIEAEIDNRPVGAEDSFRRSKKAQRHIFFFGEKRAEFDDNGLRLGHQTLHDQVVDIDQTRSYAVFVCRPWQQILDRSQMHQRPRAVEDSDIFGELFIGQGHSKTRIGRPVGKPSGRCRSGRALNIEIRTHSHTQVRHPSRAEKPVLH